MTLPTSKRSCDDRTSRTILRGGQAQDIEDWPVAVVLLTSTVNGTELSAQESRDVLLRMWDARVIRTYHCPAMLHSIAKRRSRHLTSRNEIRDELSDLASKALSPAAVRDEPKIHTCRNSEVKSDEENKENSVV